MFRSAMCITNRWPTRLCVEKSADMFFDGLMGQTPGCPSRAHAPPCTGPQGHRHLAPVWPLPTWYRYLCFRQEARTTSCGNIKRDQLVLFSPFSPAGDRHYNATARTISQQLLWDFMGFSDTSPIRHQEGVYQHYVLGTAPKRVSSEDHGISWLAIQIQM